MANKRFTSFLASKTTFNIYHTQLRIQNLPKAKYQNMSYISATFNYFFNEMLH